MDKTRIVIIAVLTLTIVGGSAFWFLTRPASSLPVTPPIIKLPQKEEAIAPSTPPPQEFENVTALLTQLKKETGIDFSATTPTNFDWHTSTEKIPITGEGFSATNIPNVEPNKVHTFFKTTGFSVDRYNISAGTIVGATGYQRENTVCLITGRINGGEAGLQREVVTSDVEIKCGTYR